MQFGATVTLGGFGPTLFPPLLRPSDWLTFLVVVAHDCILEDVGQAEADPVLLAGSGTGPGARLLLKGPLALIVRPNLVAAHPSDQPLPLAQGQRVQQTLVDLHVVGAKDVT